MLTPDADTTFITFMAVILVVPIILLLVLAVLGTWLGKPKRKKVVPRLCLGHCAATRPKMAVVVTQKDCVECKKGKKK